MTKLWGAADSGALIVVSMLTLLAAVIAEETVRRRLKARKPERRRAAKIAEAALMVARARNGHASFVRAAEVQLERNDSVEAAGGWPTVDDLRRRHRAHPCRAVVDRSRPGTAAEPRRHSGV